MRFISILEKLNSLQALTLSTTHYPEIKHFALVTEGFENASVEFNIETLSPTYKLLLGVPGTSNAFAISRKLGISEEIIREKALKLLNEEVPHGIYVEIEKFGENKVPSFEIPYHPSHPYLLVGTAQIRNILFYYYTRFATKIQYE